jgi:putative SOS response-associated peptidase YedK
VPTRIFPRFQTSPGTSTLGCMCGRYVAAKDPAALMAEFETTGTLPQQLPPDYNVAPTKQVYTVVDRPLDDHGYQRSLEVMRWGLVPSWAKNSAIGSRMINARLESVAQKPAFRSAWRRRRALIPADGFYEWYTPESIGDAKPRKQPYYIHRSDGESLAMAGIFEFRRNPEASPDEPWLRTTAIITTDASGPMAHIHERMPVMVGRDRWEEWLDPTYQGDPGDLLDPASAAAQLIAYPISTAVNSVRNNGPQLLTPLPLEDSGN